MSGQEGQAMEAQAQAPELIMGLGPPQKEKKRQQYLLATSSALPTSSGSSTPRSRGRNRNPGKTYTYGDDYLEEEEEGEGEKKKDGGEERTRGRLERREDHSPDKFGEFQLGGHTIQFKFLPRITTTIMMFLFLGSLVYIITFVNAYIVQPASQKEIHKTTSCPDYKSYSARPHPPYTSGTYKLPFQRPVEECRLFQSPAVEKVIARVTKKLKDEDLARLFENGFPNTLDTTIRWHVPGGRGEQPQSFIVTGDINAQWLRDSTNQLAGYQHLAKQDPALKKLILGAINTQADFVLASPYCNAFQPPPQSGLHPTNNGQDDIVHPIYDPTLVFECKYEIDSLASFLSLGNQYYENTKDTSFVNGKWIEAVKNVLVVIEQQQVSTFNEDGKVQDQTYTFSRNTRAGTETLNLGGIGNPLNANTSLIRSAFRPSDDATIMQYFIPGNAFMAVELERTKAVLDAAGYGDLGTLVHKKAKLITEGIYKYGVIEHPVFGKVFAYEVDGYGSHVIMDDANIPSLLSLPLLGFVKADDPIYLNTRKMVLSQSGNPYFLRGPSFSGIGGPHIGIRHAWPMSLLVQIMTTDDDDEILKLLEMVLKASRLGLVNESVDVGNLAMYTRSWFAWANAVYAQAILDLEKRKPHLSIFH